MPTEVSTGHTAKLNGREQVPEGTMALYFNKPNGFEFRAGQTSSGALKADAVQSSMCAYLAWTALGGLVLNLKTRGPHW